MTGLLYAFLCLAWGSTWLAIKIGLDGVPPFLGAGLRFLLSGAVIGVVVLLRKKPARLTQDDKIAVLSCGLLSFTFGYALVYWSEQYVSSGLTALLFSTMPLLVALLSRYWTRSETLTGRKVLGILTGIGGTAVLFWPDKSLARPEVLGMLAALASSLCASVNLVLMKRHARHSDIFVVNALGMAIGAACLLGLSLLLESHAPVRWTRDNALAVVYLALLGTVATFLIYYHLLKAMDATRLSMMSLIIPIVALALGRVFLNEPVTERTLAGVVAILGGVAVTLWPARV